VIAVVSRPLAELAVHVAAPALDAAIADEGEAAERAEAAERERAAMVLGVVRPS